MTTYFGKIYSDSERIVQVKIDEANEIQTSQYLGASQIVSPTKNSLTAGAKKFFQKSMATANHPGECESGAEKSQFANSGLRKFETDQKIKTLHKSGPDRSLSNSMIKNRK